MALFSQPEDQGFLSRPPEPEKPPRITLSNVDLFTSILPFVFELEFEYPSFKPLSFCGIKPTSLNTLHTWLSPWLGDTSELMAGGNNARETDMDVEL